MDLDKKKSFGEWYWSYEVFLPTLDIPIQCEYVTYGDKRNVLST